MNEPKIVNLDDLNKAVTITLGGKSFTISRVTLEMRQLYGEYLQHRGTYMIDVMKMQEESEKEKDVKALDKILSEITEKIEEFAITRASEIEEMLKIILEKNGIKYIKKWWESATDYQGMENFIAEALNKDYDNTGSKKKEAAS